MFPVAEEAEYNYLPGIEQVPCQEHIAAGHLLNWAKAAVAGNHCPRILSVLFPERAVVAAVDSGFAESFYIRRDGQCNKFCTLLEFYIRQGLLAEASFVRQDSLGLDQVENFYSYRDYLCNISGILRESCIRRVRAGSRLGQFLAQIAGYYYLNRNFYIRQDGLRSRPCTHQRFCIRPDLFVRLAVSFHPRRDPEFAEAGYFENMFAFFLQYLAEA